MFPHRCFHRHALALPCPSPAGLYQDTCYTDYAKQVETNSFLQKGRTSCIDTTACIHTHRLENASCIVLSLLSSARHFWTTPNIAHNRKQRSLHATNAIQVSATHANKASQRFRRHKYKCNNPMHSIHFESDRNQSHNGRKGILGSPVDVPKHPDAADHSLACARCSSNSFCKVFNKLSDSLKFGNLSPFSHNNAVTTPFTYKGNITF